MLIHPQVLNGLIGSSQHDRSTNVAPAVEVTVRRATDADAVALARLAGLDSQRVPAEPVLMAEVDGTALAAISLVDGQVVADPFERTADLVELLRVRSAQSRQRAASPRAHRLTAHSIANQT